MSGVCCMLGQGKYPPSLNSGHGCIANLLLCQAYWGGLHRLFGTARDSKNHCLTHHLLGFSLSAGIRSMPILLSLPNQNTVPCVNRHMPSCIGFFCPLTCSDVERRSWDIARGGPKISKVSSNETIQHYVLQNHDKVIVSTIPLDAEIHLQIF